MSKYFTQDSLFFSAVSGRGIYRWDGERIADPLNTLDREPVSPVLTDIAAGETYFTKRIEGSGLTLPRCRKHILSPPENANVLWPSDIVCIPEAKVSAFRLFADREYAEVLTPPEQRTGELALLFPCGSYPVAEDGLNRLRRLSRSSWKAPEIQNMAVEIVRAIDRLNRCGYAYGDIHPSRFLFLENGSVFLDYSNLIYSFRGPAAYACAPPPGAYPIEFAEPAYVRGVQKTLDFDSQNYSLCALLFYLFFGRCPYDGRLLTGYTDSNPQEHYAKFRDYHKMPVFIFDPLDGQNALGAFGDERYVIELWAELPAGMQQMFVAALSENNAMRAADRKKPPPAAWLRQFEQAGWLERQQKTEQEARA